MPAIIGIDCATQPGKTGLALAHVEGSVVVIEEMEIGSEARKPVAIVADWVANRDPFLLALDAPLGWPIAMGRALIDHKAGDGLSVVPDQLFRRATDEAIEKRLEKRPLEVGANLIARTAHAALKFLDEVRKRTGLPIPMAWQPGVSSGGTAIEVYPAATRIAHGARDAPGSLEGLETTFRLLEACQRLSSEHARDAIVCAIAGADFLAGLAVPPTNWELALREGWIWTRRHGDRP